MSERASNSTQDADVIVFGRGEEKDSRPTPRYSKAELDEARPGEDFETEYTPNGQIPTYDRHIANSMLKNLYADSGLIIEYFKNEPGLTPAEMLSDYQEIHEVSLGDAELSSTLGWMDDLAKKALNKGVSLETKRREEAERQRRMRLKQLQRVQGREIQIRGEAS